MSPDSSSPSTSVSLKDRRILVIDDDASMRLLATKILTAAGARVSDATSASEGLELFMNNPYDLVLLDLNMPGEDGFSFLEKRNILERLRLIPVVVCSGRNDQDSVRKAITLGARDFIIKPFYANSLLEKLVKFFN